MIISKAVMRYRQNTKEKEQHVGKRNNIKCIVKPLKNALLYLSRCCLHDQYTYVDASAAMHPQLVSLPKFGTKHYCMSHQHGFCTTVREQHKDRKMLYLL